MSRWEYIQSAKQFFPDNAVQYFVSYYDYYQPEAYIPSVDMRLVAGRAVLRTYLEFHRGVGSDRFRTFLYDLLTYKVNPFMVVAMPYLAAAAIASAFKGNVADWIYSAMVKVLPEPVTPSSVCACLPWLTPCTSSYIPSVDKYIEKDLMIND